jgi:hypothetical protein
VEAGAVRRGRGLVECWGGGDVGDADGLRRAGQDFCLEGREVGAAREEIGREIGDVVKLGGFLRQLPQLAELLLGRGRLICEKPVKLLIAGLVGRQIPVALAQHWRNEGFVFRREDDGGELVRDVLRIVKGLFENGAFPRQAFALLRCLLLLVTAQVGCRADDQASCAGLHQAPIRRPS